MTYHPVKKIKKLDLFYCLIFFSVSLFYYFLSSLKMVSRLLPLPPFVSQSSLVSVHITPLKPFHPELFFGSLNLR